jgi:hypothetical protein
MDKAIRLELLYLEDETTILRTWGTTRPTTQIHIPQDKILKGHSE